MKKLWPKLRKYAKGEIRSRLDRVEVPTRDSDGEIIGWRSVTAPAELFKTLLAQNVTHFSQAKDTPFVTGPLGQKLHPFEQNQFSESILQGTVNLTGLSLNTAIHACIQEMCFPSGEDGLDPVSDLISSEDLSDEFKMLSEDISSSPSGRHIGHYKAALGDPDLCTMYATVLSIPFKHGFTLHWWTSAVQVMLEKTKGCARVDKLRVIQLMEADLNMALHIIFGRRLIHRAEDQGTIPLTQCGSQPNRSSTDAILLKRISYDGLSLCRKSAIIFNNDCKAAFDQMIPSVGGIALRRLGASSSSVSTLLQTLQQMKYKVKTSLGLSEESFSNADNWVLGTLQGSEASPCLWLTITCVLLGALQKRSPGITFSNPQGTLTCNCIGKAYVDDTELWLTMPDRDITQLAQEMQKIAQHWEQLLYTTGGALALGKYFYVALQWSFPNDEHTLCPPSMIKTDIALTSGNMYHRHMAIAQSAPSEGRRNLGAWIAPDDNNAADLQII